MTQGKDDPKFPRCPDCGGEVRLKAGRDRNRALVHGVLLPVPDSFRIPTCTRCGAESMTPEVSEELDAILRRN